MSGFCAFVLNLSKSGNILFRLMSNGSFMFSCHWYLGDNSLVHDLRVMLMAAVELDVNATYYFQQPALNEISLWTKTTSNWW